MCFAKKQIPDRLPESLQNIVDELKKSKNKEECLRRAYDVLAEKYMDITFQNRT
ncbi:MAG: hypothetical protein V1655_00240 [bacterium]